MRHLSCFSLFFVLCLLGVSAFAHAQDSIEQPAPEFLYRDGDRLLLLNGYTGEVTEVLSGVSEFDRFEWSPSGDYLLTMFALDQSGRTCLNLFEMVKMEWVYPEPIACDVQEAVFSKDETKLYYIVNDEDYGRVWLFNRSDETKQELYRSVQGRLNSVALSHLTLSPFETSITFYQSVWIMNGPNNTFFIMNTETHQFNALSAPNQFYASYEPIWSLDEDWFLIRLQEEYVTLSTLPITNHQGDIYLVHSETGSFYRLTYSPAMAEYDVHWTQDGQIAFREVVERSIALSVDEAIALEALPDDEIVWPDPIDPDDYALPYYAIVSPDYGLLAWINDAVLPRELNIGGRKTGNASFTFTLSSSYTLFGWRPSDFPYGIG